MNVLQIVVFLCLLYIAGIVLLSAAAGISWGILIFHTVLFMTALWFPGKKRGWRFGLIFLFAVITIAICTVPDSLKLQMLMQEILCIGIIGYMTWKKVPVISYCHIRRIQLYHLPLILLETFLLIVVTGFINACSMLFFANTVTDTLTTAARYLPASLLILGLVPAVTEEIIFRGCMLRSFHNIKTGIALSAAIFALWHFNLNQMSYAFVAGLLLAFMAVWTDNLTCSILTHSLFNIYNVSVAALIPGTLPAQLLSSFKVGSYCPLVPNIVTESGRVIWTDFCWGLISLSGAMAVYFAVLYLMRYLYRRS